MLTQINWNEVWSEILKWLSTEGVRLLLGLIAVFLAFKIINILAKGVKKGLTKKETEKTIIYVTDQIIRKGLKIAVLVIFLGYIGIDTAGIGAIISSIGIAIGLALQGSLGNFAGGVVIILMRPFKIGDYIEAQGNSGTVEKIGAFYTTIVTPDNKVIMIPNGALANGNITDYSTKETRRLELKFAISHQDDFEKAKKCIEEVVKLNKAILKKPNPFINVAEYTDYAIIIVIRVWVKGTDFWPVNFWMLENVKLRFDEEQISMPYRQLDVHITNKNQ